MTARLGRVVGGKYRLESVLGTGGMATVYRASHANGHAVAVKILHPELSLRADLRERFLREGYIANSVPHEGAVTVLDDGVLDEGPPFLVIELLEGETVEARLARSGEPLPIAEVADMMDRLLAILEAAHARGIVHRDVKPANLFLTREGTLKLLDFGIARMLDAEGSSQTATGAVPGSPAFMAPEQALGFASEIDPRTDLFAVGSTMFLLLSGRPIHVARTPAELHVFACSRPAPALRSVAPTVPEPMARVVDRLLSFSKEGRPPSASAARAELVEARLAPRRARRGAWMVAGALALLAGGVALSPKLAARADVADASALVAPPAASSAPLAAREPAGESSMEDESKEDEKREDASVPTPPPAVTPRASIAPRIRPPRRKALAPAGRDAGAPAVRERCEPPYYVDPETGTRRVKPGC